MQVVQTAPAGTVACDPLKKGSQAEDWQRLTVNRGPPFATATSVTVGTEKLGPLELKLYSAVAAASFPPSNTVDGHLETVRLNGKLELDSV